MQVVIIQQIIALLHHGKAACVKMTDTFRSDIIKPGSGIKRALKEYPYISFTNDKEGNLFTVTIKRPELKGR